MNEQFQILTFITALGLSAAADAALVSRLRGQAMYNTDRNITWLTDANLAASNTFGAGVINLDDSMTWATAVPLPAAAWFLVSCLAVLLPATQQRAWLRGGRAHRRSGQRSST